MSIKSFSNQYCPDCKSETLHHAMKCHYCGHINMTPSEHRAKCHSRRLTVRVVKLGMTHRHALADMRKHDGANAAAKRRDSLTYATVPKGRGR